MCLGEDTLPNISGVKGGARYVASRANMESYVFTPGQQLEVTADMQKSFEGDGYILVRYV